MIGHQDLGPEAMFFKPNGGAEFEIWAWDYHEPNIPWAECDGDVWYQVGWDWPRRGHVTRC